MYPSVDPALVFNTTELLQINSTESILAVSLQVN